MKYGAFLLVLSLALPVAADEIVLRNGSRIEGRVKEAGDEVVVVMDMGTVTFKRSDVTRIILSPSAIQEFDEKVRQLKSDDTEGRVKLALWARQRQLDNRAKSLLEEILVIAPDHAGARAELGYTKFNGRWMTDDEVKAAQGLVKFRGAWIKQTEAQEILQREADRVATVARDADLARAQKALLEAQAEYERAKAEGERIRARVQQELYDSLPRYAPIVVWHYHVVDGRCVRCCCCANGR